MNSFKPRTSPAIIVAVASFLATAPFLKAQLPPAEISENYSVGIGNGEVTDNLSSAGPLSFNGSTTFASANLSFSGSNSPSPNFIATGSLAFTPNPDEDTDLASIGIGENYSLEINGPQPTVSVLVDADGHVSLDKATPFNGGSSDVTFSVRTGFGAFTVNDTIQAGPDPSVQPTSASFDDDNVYTFQTGKIYTVEVEAGISLVGPFGISDTVTGSASIDPTFAIASSVGDPGDYTFEFSSGIGNTPQGGGGNSVPDGTSTLGLLACVTIGLFAWSRGSNRHLADRVA